MADPSLLTNELPGGAPRSSRSLRKGENLTRLREHAPNGSKPGTRPGGPERRGSAQQRLDVRLAVAVPALDLVLEGVDAGVQRLAP